MNHNIFTSKIWYNDTIIEVDYNLQYIFLWVAHLRPGRTTGRIGSYCHIAQCSRCICFVISGGWWLVSCGFKRSTSRKGSYGSQGRECQCPAWSFDHLAQGFLLHFFMLIYVFSFVICFCFQSRSSYYHYYYSYSFLLSRQT